MSQHVGPRRHPDWLDALMQFVMFCLGVLSILYPILVSTTHVVAYMVTGLVLLGIVRLPDLLRPPRPPAARREDDS